MKAERKIAEAVLRAWGAWHRRQDITERRRGGGYPNTLGTAYRQMRNPRCTRCVRGSRTRHDGTTEVCTVCGGTGSVRYHRGVSPVFIRSTATLAEQFEPELYKQVDTIRDRLADQARRVMVYTYVRYLGLPKHQVARRLGLSQAQFSRAIFDIRQRVIEDALYD